MMFRLNKKIIFFIALIMVLIFSALTVPKHFLIVLIALLFCIIGGFLIFNLNNSRNNGKTNSNLKARSPGSLKTKAKTLKGNSTSMQKSNFQTLPKRKSIVWDIFKKENLLKTGSIWIMVLLVAAFIVRLIAALSYKGFENDIISFSSWAQTMLTGGPFEFYRQTGSDGYPPLYNIILGIFGGVAKIMNLSYGQSGYFAIIKMPAILCDIAMGLFIYKISKRKFVETTALLLASLYLFNPAIIVNSASWGQVDSVFTLAVVLFIYFLVERKLYISMPVFLIGLLIKPQTVIFAPILLLGLVWEIKTIFSEKKANEKYKPRVKKNIISFLSCVATFFAFSIVFSITMEGFAGSLTWLLKTYLTIISSYPYADMSAFNFFGLIGGQWVKDSLPIISGISWLTWKFAGNISILLIVFTTIFMFIKSKNKNKSLFILAAFLIFGVCTFSSGVHERYVYPAIALMMVSYLYINSKSLLYLFVGLSALQYINVASVLFVNNKPETYFTSNDFIFVAGSFLTVVLFVIFTVLSYRLSKNGAILEPQKVANPQKVMKDANSKKSLEASKGASTQKSLEASKGANILKSKGNKTPFTKFTTKPSVSQLIQEYGENSMAGKRLKARDYVIMILITMVYLVVALFNLGDMKSPGTYWEPREMGGYSIADFGEVQTVQRLYYFGSIGEGTFTISSSLDGVGYTEVKTVEFVSGEIYNWRKISFESTDITARFIKVECIEPGFRLLEIGCFSSADATVTIPVMNVTGLDNEKVQKNGFKNVFDEQIDVPAISSFRNGMYFDEIYHARTAFEYINGWPIYETTHPPLGKEIISLGIILFGMNPFGWRIMGMLAGVLMLPAMFILGKKLFGRTRWAVGLTLLMALDGMHFAQTRISTIDSFVVLFIILMYLFMYMYYTSNFYTKPFWKGLIPLGFSGIFFGLAIASKWIGLYGAVGLAIIFFISYYNRYKEYLEAQRELLAYKPREGVDREFLTNMTLKFKLYSYITLGFCVLMFIIVPFAIYSLSYIPYYKLYSVNGDWLKVLISSQTGMFSYHSGLSGNNHPFKSPWYEWPLIIKPMWYYAAPELSDSSKIESISSFGNPVIWWSGFVCFFAGGFMLVKDYLRYKRDRFSEKTIELGNEIKLGFFLFIGVASNYLPWVLISRSTFIYHYFSTLPFVMGITIFVAKRILEKQNNKSPKWYYLAFFVICFIVFLAFYPLWSGFPVSADFARTWLKWFPNWSIGV